MTRHSAMSLMKLWRVVTAYRAMAIVLMLLVAACASLAASRGERSYRVPEVGQSPAPFGNVVSRASWTQMASSLAQPTWPGVETLAIAGRLVVFAQNERVCAFRDKDGRRVWCATHGSMPAYAGGEVAYVGDDGWVSAVDANTGAPLWRFAFSTSREGAQIAGPPQRLAQAVWSSGPDFLIARLDGRGGHGAPNFGEVSTSGAALWSMQSYGTFSRPRIVAPYVLQPHVEGGATLSRFVDVLRTGSHAGKVGTIANASDILAVRGNDVVVAEQMQQEVQDDFLTARVSSATLPTGRVTSDHRYEPDYEENLALWQRNALPNVGDWHVAYDGDDVYVVVGRKLYRYRFESASTERPLLISDDGTYVAPPHDGAILVQRGGSLWILRPRQNAVDAFLIAASTARVSLVAFAQGDAYIASDDGLLRGVDLRDGETTLLSKACRASEMYVSATRVYVVCAGSPQPRVVAFPRAQSASVGLMAPKRPA